MITLENDEYIALRNDAEAYRNLKEKKFKYTLLTRPEVEKITRLTRSTIYRAIAENSFPKPIKPASGQASGQRSFWLLHEIEEWIEERMEERGNPNTDDDA